MSSATVATVSSRSSSAQTRAVRKRGHSDAIKKAMLLARRGSKPTIVKKHINMRLLDASDGKSYDRDRTPREQLKSS